jgi:hypothetical protein
VLPHTCRVGCYTSLAIGSINQSIFFFVHDLSLHSVRAYVIPQSHLLRLPVIETKHVDETSWTTDHDRAQDMSLLSFHPPTKQTASTAFHPTTRIPSTRKQRYHRIRTAVHHQSNVHQQRRSLRTPFSNTCYDITITRDLPLDSSYP